MNFATVSCLLQDYSLFCPYAYRLPSGALLAKDLAVEYKYLSESSEWFYIARKKAEEVIGLGTAFKTGTTDRWEFFIQGYRANHEC